MNILMAGIDFHKADVAQREPFSLTAAALARTLRQIRRQPGVDECLLISTCNRTELWVCGNQTDGTALFPVKLLSEARGLDETGYLPYFTVRQGMDAVRYLCELASGIHSQIFGDDQIISQVKNALHIAREEHCAGTVLEVLFRTAVTAAKKVKSSVLCSAVDRSVAAAVLRLLQEQHISVAGKPCLVIGNGEIGRLTAANLEQAGGKVTMTLRQYKHRDTVIPAGCSVIPYEDRYKRLGDFQIVVSATTSPHHTLVAEQVRSVLKQETVFLDLALPRDIEPEVRTLPLAALFDMDCFSSLTQQAEERQLAAVRAVLTEFEEEFETWYSFRQYIPAVQQISKLSGKETAARLKKELRSYPLSDSEQEVLLRKIQNTSAKVVSNILFGLREELGENALEESFRALSDSAKRLQK